MAVGALRRFRRTRRGHGNRIRTPSGKSARRLGLPGREDSRARQRAVPDGSDRQAASEGRTLADVLEVEGNADVPDARVQDILASISLVEAPGDSDASVAIGVDGRFWQGVARGRHVKADAEYIGTTARARRREARIAEIDAALEELAAAVDTAKALVAQTNEQLSRINSAAKELPKTGSILRALKTVTESAAHSVLARRPRKRHNANSMRRSLISRRRKSNSERRRRSTGPPAYRP